MTGWSCRTDLVALDLLEHASDSWLRGTTYMCGTMSASLASHFGSWYMCITGCERDQYARRCPHPNGHIDKPSSQNARSGQRKTRAGIPRRPRRGESCQVRLNGSGVLSHTCIKPSSKCHRAMMQEYGGVEYLVSQLLDSTAECLESKSNFSSRDSY